MGLKLICQGIWVARDRAIWFTGRGVIGSRQPGNIFRLLFLLELKKGLTEHSPITTTISNHSHPPCQPRAYMLAQLRRGGRRKSRIRRRLGWGLLSQWRSEILMRRSARGKAEILGRGWLDFIIGTRCFRPRPLSLLVVSSCLSMMYIWWTPV